MLLRKRVKWVRLAGKYHDLGTYAYTYLIFYGDSLTDFICIFNSSLLLSQLYYYSITYAELFIITIS